VTSRPAVFVYVVRATLYNAS